MFGLTRDFVEQGGTFMVLDRQEGLMSNDLSQVQLGMIRSSRIPCFLPMHTKELDLSVTLQYNITGKRMLSQALRGEKLTLTEFYGLLLQIVSALNDCSMYMLRPEQYILHEEYMFIEGPLHLNKLYMTYVPLDRYERESEALRHSFKELVMRLVSYVSELRGSGVQTLMQYCNDESFNLLGLKQVLIDLLAGEGGHGEQPSDVSKPRIMMTDSTISKFSHPMNDDPAIIREKTSDTHTSRSNLTYERGVRSGHPLTDMNSSSAYHLNEDRQPKGRSSVAEENRGKESSRAMLQSRGQAEPDLSLDDDSDEQKNTSSVRIYWLLGGLLGSATMWRFLYLNNPSQVMLLVSILGTIVLVGVSLMGWQGKIGKSPDGHDDYSEPLPMFDSVELEESGRHRLKSFRFQADKLTGWFGSKAKDKTQDEESTDHEEWRWERQAPSSLHAHQEFQFGEQRSNVSSEYQPDDSESETSSGDYYKQLPQRTEILSPSGDAGTVLLERKAGMTKEGERRSPSQPSAFLEVIINDNGVSERVELHQPHFIIGRSAEVSQYVSQIVGTSRAHVEISRGTAGFKIKDLGSRNGTILKGEPMVPYKEYSLEEGDTFLIAGGKYMFHAA